jgi:hypothetical protein
MAARSRNVPKADINEGTIRPGYVFTRCIFDMMRKSGIEVISVGIINIPRKR